MSILSIGRAASGITLHHCKRHDEWLELSFSFTVDQTAFKTRLVPTFASATGLKNESAELNQTVVWKLRLLQNCSNFASDFLPSARFITRLNPLVWWSLWLTCKTTLQLDAFLKTVDHVIIKNDVNDIWSSCWWYKCGCRKFNWKNFSPFVLPKEWLRCSFKRPNSVLNPFSGSVSIKEAIELLPAWLVWLVFFSKYISHNKFLSSCNVTSIRPRTKCSLLFLSVSRLEKALTKYFPLQLFLCSVAYLELFLTASAIVAPTRLKSFKGFF